MAAIPSFKINRAFNLKNVKLEDFQVFIPWVRYQEYRESKYPLPSGDSEVQQNLSLALKAIPIGDRKVKSNVNN